MYAIRSYYEIKAFQVGGVDYIVKPFQAEEVLARVNTHLTIYRLKKSLDEKNKQLQEVNDYLEQRVKERTAQLVQLNTAYERFVPREFLSLLKKDVITSYSIHYTKLYEQFDPRV